LNHTATRYGKITSRNTIQIEDLVCFGEH